MDKMYWNFQLSIQVKPLPAFAEHVLTQEQLSGLKA